MTPKESLMAHPTHLSRAPIVEALVDIRVYPEVPQLSDLDRFQAVVQSDFPERRKVVHVTGNFDLRDAERPKVTTAEPDVKGYAFWSADKKRVVQARRDGFSFSHLNPYDQWTTLRDQARSLWTKYVSLMNPATTTRWALRFINRIELPLPMSDLADYLRTLPRISDDLPQQVTGLFMRVVLPFPPATVIVTQAVDAGLTEDKLPIVLDIDVFEEGQLPCDGDEVWTHLETLRKIKNDVFFSSLTPAAWRLYE
jgi:uncharacterized protein (TIGR04255 family)